MIDCHVHTKLCGHAKGVMESYVLRAIDIGLETLCFLDHLTAPETEKGLSMTLKEVPLYFQAVQRLKYKYKRALDLKAGLEIDFSPGHFGRLLEAAAPFSFDVIGGAVHFPGGIDIVSGASPMAKGEIDADCAYSLYLESLEKMIEYGSFDVVCHFDLVKKFKTFSPTHSFEKRMEDILLKIKAADMTLEVNASGFEHPAGEAYPGCDIIKKCFKNGIDLTLGSDAHTPGDVGRHGKRVLRMMRSAGYEYAVAFSKRKKEKIPL